MRSEDMEYKRLLVWAKAKRACSRADDGEKWASVIDMILRYPELIDRHEMAHKLRNAQKFNNCDVPQWAYNMIEGKLKGGKEQ